MLAVENLSTEYPGDHGQVVRAAQDVTFGVDMDDGTSLAGVTLKLTIREDPEYPRRWTGEQLARRLLEAGDDPATWTAVVTSTTLASPAPTGYDAGVTVARAVMADLKPGADRYILEVARSDSGNVSPIVPLTFLSVRPAVSRP